MANRPKVPGSTPEPSGFADAPQAASKIELPPVTRHERLPGGRFKVGAGGRIVIPADIRELLGVKEGDVLLGTFKDGRLTLKSVATTIADVRAMLGPFEGLSMVDELLAERRAEAAREDEESFEKR
jgi:AbrB family looped-hinge helix DNA binding protein